MKNNKDIFIELLRPEYSDALKYCKALCSKRSAEDAQDVLQQSFLKALENFDSLSDKSKFKSWFFKIITREFYNLIRNDFWKKFLPVGNPKSNNEFPNVYSRQDENGIGILLRKALSVISNEERSAILLFEIGGFSIEEIRNIQNEKSLSSIKSRLSRARKKMKDFIEKEEENLNKQILNKTINIGDINNETIRLLPETDGK